MGTATLSGEAEARAAASRRAVDDLDDRLQFYLYGLALPLICVPGEQPEWSQGRDIALACYNLLGNLVDHLFLVR